MHQPPPFPTSRPRRLRRDEFSRSLVREHRLHPSDLILPVLVLTGSGTQQDVASMPGVKRVTLDLLYPVAEECVKLGIPKRPLSCQRYRPFQPVDRAVCAVMRSPARWCANIDSTRRI